MANNRFEAVLVPLVKLGLWELSHNAINSNGVLINVQYLMIKALFPSILHVDKVTMQHKKGMLLIC